MADDRDIKEPKYSSPTPRKGKGEMPADELKSIMGGLISDAHDYSETVLRPDRLEAEAYYKGEPFGNEQSGRSQFVATEVRDSILGVLPSIMRILFGPERVVEMAPRGAADAPLAQRVKLAKQATEYVQYVFAEDNQGFIKTYSVLKDGLLKKLGIFMWGARPCRPRVARLENVTDAELDALGQDPSVEITRREKCEDGINCVDIRSKDDYDEAFVETVPPEEFIFSREARDDKSAVMVGRRWERSRSDLIADGVPEDIIDEYGKTDEGVTLNQDEMARRPDDSSAQRDPESGKANDKILWCETYPYIDVDGDGISELRQVCTIGPNYHPVPGFNKPAEERPFALFTPDPEPHAMIGGSMFDRTGDLQFSKSMLLRSIFDSLALSIYPRTAAVEGQVSIEDLLNTEIGAVIRMRAPGMAQPFEHRFTGADGLPLLGIIDGIKEQRTGQSNGTMGLDADALQSSTADAVSAAVNASQEHKELLVRIFAEMTFKPLFRGLYRTIVRSKQAERIVRLRGEFVPINTQAWEPEMEVIVTVGMGTSLTEQRVMTLTGIAGKQEAIIQMLGPANPLCSLSQLRETYARILELKGFMDTTAFFNVVPPDWQPPQAAPQKTPEQTLAETQLQIEQMRTQKDLQIKQAELELKQQAQSHSQQLEEAKLANDFVLRRAELEMKYKTTFTQMQLEQESASEEAALQDAKDAVDIHSQRQDAEKQHARADAQQQHDQELAQQAQSHQQGLAEDQQAHDQSMAERQTAAAEQAAPAGGGEE